MAKVNTHLLAFNAGEVSRIALARIDLARMRMSAECQVNWMPFALGAMMLRPGMQQLFETKSDAAGHMVDFVYAKDDTAMLHFTANVMRVAINDALISRVAVSTTVGDANFSGSGAWSTADTTAGCSATVSGGLVLQPSAVGGLARAEQTLTISGADQNKEHGLRIQIDAGPVTVRIGSAAGLSDYLAQTSLDTGTHSLAFTPTGTSAFLQIEARSSSSANGTQAQNVGQQGVTVRSCAIEAAGVMELPTPWGAADLTNLRGGESQGSRSGDEVFLACYGGFQQRIIQRRGTRPGARGWSIVVYKPDTGPFLENPPIVANLTPSAYFANGTLSSDRPYFQTGHVGALFRLFTGGQTNQTVLGAGGAFTEPIRVSGVGNDRKFNWAVSGTWAGNIVLQRSLVGPLSGFTSVQSNTVNGSYAMDDTGTLNNVVAWYRVGFPRASDYTSGAATVSFTSGSGAFNDATTGAATGAGGKWGTCRVTGYTSPTQVSIEILDPFSALVPTSNWQEGAFSSVQGYPSSVCFDAGRLYWFGAAALPIVGSEAGRFFSFREEDSAGQAIGDSGAILADFGSGPEDRINFAVSLTRLVAGREMAMTSIFANAFSDPITVATVQVKDFDTHGAARLPAVKLGKRAIYAQQDGRRLYECFYNVPEADMDYEDLTKLNLDLGAPGFVDASGSHQPDKQAFFPRADGQCAVVLRDTREQVSALWRIMTLGVIENVRVLPNPSGGGDYIYFIVKRVINGSTKRFVEKLALRENCVGAVLNHQLDCFYAYTGAAVSSVTVSWLPSTLVSVWADGAFIGTATADGSGVVTMPDGETHTNIVVGLAGAATTVTSDGLTGSFAVGSAYNGYPAEIWADIAGTGKLTHLGAVTVSGGNVTLPNGATALKCVAMLGYVAPFQSAKLAYAAEMGSPLNQKKRIDHVGVIGFDMAATSLTYGQRFDELDDMPGIEQGAEVPAGTVWPEYDEPMSEFPGEWDTDARVCFLAQAPNPVKIGALVLGIASSG